MARTPQRSHWQIVGAGAKTAPALRRATRLGRPFSALMTPGTIGWPNPPIRRVSTGQGRRNRIRPSIPSSDVRIGIRSGPGPAQPIKVPTRRATRDGRRIAAGMIAPPLPGASALLRFLTKRDISGTAPGPGARLSERLASNASGLRRNR